MTNETLQKAIKLSKIIDITKSGLEKAYKFKMSKSEVSASDYCSDGLYGMYIGKYSDNSGDLSMNLCRSYGNVELLSVIIAELERQLKYFEDEYAKL